MGLVIGNAIGLGFIQGGGYGSELNNVANAASIINEANAVLGITAIGLNLLQSQGVVVNDGSYAIEANANGSPTASARCFIDLAAVPFSFVNGEDGKITFQVRHIGTGGAWSCGLGEYNTGTETGTKSIAPADITFSEVEIIFTYGQHTHYLVFRELNGTNDGGVYWDKLSVKKKI